MSESKLFKVIKIIDEYNVIINAGLNDGLKEDNILEIFVEGDPIIDPETNKKLGTLDTIKAKLIIKKAYENFSICGNYETTASPQHIAGVLAQNMQNMSDIYKKQPKRLNVDSTQISGGFKEEEDMKIKIGDLVRKSL